MIKMKKGQRLLIITIALAAIAVLGIVLCSWLFFLVFTPKPSYNTINHYFESERSKLTEIADYYYHLEYYCAWKDEYDPVGTIYIRNQEDTSYSEAKIESLVIEQETNSFFELNKRTFYKGFSMILKKGNYVMFQKWSTRDAGIYVVFAPDGEASIAAEFKEAKHKEIIPLSSENWYYCYRDYLDN